MTRKWRKVSLKKEENKEENPVLNLDELLNRAGDVPTIIMQARVEEGEIEGVELGMHRTLDLMDLIFICDGIVEQTMDKLGMSEEEKNELRKHLRDDEE